jgi:hypothetical protein
MGKIMNQGADAMTNNGLGGNGRRGKTKGGTFDPKR